MGKLIDLMGYETGYLKVIKRIGQSKDGNVLWLCKCKCGNEAIIQGRNLKSNRVKSCGCYISEKHTKHNQYGTRLYRIWCNIKRRCYDNKHKSYKYYGGKEIIMCDDWKNDFISFYNWAINNGYNDNLSIDRIDNDKGYYPDNCRWVTNLEQQNNKTNNVYLEYNGEIKTISEWSNKLNIKHSTLLNRYKRGYSVYDILNKPVNKTKILKKGVNYEQ